MIYDYEYFKAELLALTSIDLNCYSEKQMRRRIDALIAQHKTEGYERYIARLKAERGLLEEFIDYITINVSEFYRDPDQWKLLDEQMIPELIRRFGYSLKVWSAACSTGDEPYSLVMALSGHIPLVNIHVLATDLDRQAIRKAKAALYDDKSVAAVPEDRKRKFFSRRGSSFKVMDIVKARVEFREHNLLKDAYPVGFHMIVCRNVLIYFTEEAKDEVYRKYFKSLLPGGILFVGTAEQIVNYRDIGFERLDAFFYKKPM